MSIEKRLKSFGVHKAVNQELIEKYAFYAQYYGERDAKIDLACARRTATTLEKTARSFTQLSEKDHRALLETASAMRRLAGELQAIVTWAKAFFAHCERERKQEKDELCRAQAFLRWQGNAEACAFEASIIEELMTKEGRISFAQWMHSTGQYRSISPENFAFNVKFGVDKNLEIRTIQAINSDLNGDSLSQWGMGYYRGHSGHEYYHIEKSSYEAYLTWRKSMAAIVHTTLSDIAGGQRSEI